jgi:hypothetical protein
MCIEAINCDRLGGNKIFAYSSDRAEDVIFYPQVDEHYLGEDTLKMAESHVACLFLDLQILFF